VAFVPLVLSEALGRHLLGAYGKPAVIALGIIGYFVIVRPRQGNKPGQRQQALYAARTIRGFLDDSGGEWDWDDFTSCSLDDPQVELIRKRALTVSLPVDEEGRTTLTALAEQSEKLAH
jgi:hypothetical protein